MPSSPWMRDSFRVVVCGGDQSADRTAVFRALDKVHAKRAPEVVVVGCGSKVGALALEWAAARSLNREVLGMPSTSVEAVNEMLLQGAKAVIAFPGAAELAQLAEAARLPVWRPYG